MKGAGPEGAPFVTYVEAQARRVIAPLRSLESAGQYGPLRDRLMSGEGKFVQKELQRGILSDALAGGEVVEGVMLLKGSHIRLR